MSNDVGSVGIEVAAEVRRRRPKMKGEGRVYRYGAREPIDLDLVRDQFRLGHRYRNALVEVELRRRAAVSALLARLSPEMATVEAEIGEGARDEDPEAGAPASPATGLLGRIEALEAEVRGTRIEARGRPKLDRPELTAMRARLKELRARRKALRKAIFDDPEWDRASEAIRATSDEQAKAARAAASAAGLYWGTYLVVERAAESFRRGAPPRFRPWSRRKDRLAVQLQKGMSVAEASSGGDSRVRLVEEERPERRCQSCLASALRARRGLLGPDRPCECSSLPPPSPRRGWRAVVWLRVGSAGREPVWARVPIAYSRPLPEGARIKWVYLVRRSVGVHDEWSVQFVLERPNWDPGDRATSGAVGIDVGWRRLRDGALRVAVWSGSDGSEGEVALPAWWVRESKRVDAIRSERDRLFDAARDALRAWLSGREGLPDFLREARQTLHAWRSTRRLARIALEWRGVEDPAHEALAALEAWRRRDRHLLTFQENLRKQLQRSRQDLYRVAAARLSRRYAAAHLEDLDLRDWHELPDVEQGADARDDAIRKHVRRACLSVFRTALERRMRSIVRAPAACTTMRCHACSEVEREPVGPKLRHACSRCGAEWDQDVNAARNLLAASGSVVEGQEEALDALERWSYGEVPNRRRRETEARWAAARS